MKMEVISRETIKPSSSTPPHLKHYKLSLLDQFAISSFVRIVLFYNHIPNQQSIQNFKKSLADTLTLYYPLAGKYIKDQSFIDCNDHGALFIEARVEGDVAVADSYVELESLLPMGHVMSETQDEILVAVQATQFSNAISIGISVTHKILDGTGFAAFIKCWADHATHKEIDSPTFVASKIWLPMENPPANLQITSPNNVNRSEGEVVTKKFFFSAMDIANLKERAIKGKTMVAPTRVEAVMALLWRCLILTTAEIRDGNWAHLVVFPVNLRTRMVPPLEKTSFGSIIKSAMALATPEDRDVGIDELAGRIRAASRKVDDEYARNSDLFHGVFLIHEPFRGEIFGKLGGREMMESCVVTSWCGFRLHETDFGWGRPDQVRCEPNVMNKNLALLTDAKDGVGIEVLLTLGMEEMTLLLKFTDLAEFTSPSSVV